MCRMCGKSSESVPHVLAGCGTLAQTKYLARHKAALKILFFEMLMDLELISEVPPWHTMTKPKPLYANGSARALSDVPVYADSIEVRAKRIDARIVAKEQQRVITIEMSCPWLDNREVKEMEKIQKYGPLMWELRERNPGYQVKQYNIIIDVLGGYSADVSHAVKELVGEKSSSILQRMQRSVISNTLNIARSFKILA